jgi:tetratricopeptide (TPR) repeat protein
MIEYKLDDLGWEGFEQLAQSLLKAKLGLGIEAWGGSGDWGRDAYFHGTLNYPTHAARQGGFVFQSKFVGGANAAGAKPDGLILNAVRKECLRIKANISPAGRWPDPPTCYALFTNAVLKPETRIRIQELIKEVLHTSEVCIHDGVDVCAWLRLSPEVARSFEPLSDIAPEIEKAVKGVKEVGEKVDSIQKKEIRAKLHLAQTLSRQEKLSEGIRELEAALSLAQAAKLPEEEVEVLIALGLLSSSRRGIGNRRGYLDQAEKIIGEIEAASVRVLYFRARAAACRDERDRQGAEDALRLALECCESTEDDKNKNLETQACVIRSELIILLCEQDRRTEASELVTACDAYARAHSTDEDGELMQAAMSAGVFWALKSGNDQEAIRRIHELETSAQTAHQAGRIGGQLSNMANNSSHLGFHAAALAAAEAAVRLGQQAGDKRGFDLGALYTVAVVTFHAGDHAVAKRKAEALLDACNDPKDAIIKQAANHLIAEIARGAGDAEKAVALASEALASASGRPEEVAFTKQAVARALSDNGQTEEALAHAREAFELMKAGGVPAQALADVLFQVISYSSVLGRSVDASEALNALSLLEPDCRSNAEGQKSIAEIQETAPKLAEMNATLRDRILKASAGNQEDDVDNPQEAASLAQANAKVMKSLLSFWDAIPSKYPGSASVAYDFWGRGNFARILRNARTIPSALNITIEVRTLDGLKQAIRLWTLYADLLLLIWKGPTEDGKRLDALPECAEVFDGPGGAGYILGSPINDESSGRRVWLCLVHASVLPVEVVAFLMKEARPLLEAGRLVVVPATGVGCVHPGHGPLEQLLTESANAVAGLRGSGKSNEVPIGLIPYSPDAPFDLLADIAQAQQRELRKLRRLLVRRTHELAPNEAGIIANRELALEIHDVLSDLADQQSATARERGLASAKEPLNGSFCRFHRDGSRLLPCSASSPSPFAPLLTLHNFGYKWGVGSLGSQPQGRYEPGKRAVVGPWLALPTERWSILAVRAEA